MSEAAPLSDEAVRAIRRSVDAGAQYGVSPHIAARIHKRQIYKDVTDTPPESAVRHFWTGSRWMAYEEFPLMVYHADGSHRIVHDAAEEQQAASDGYTRRVAEATPPPSEDAESA